MLELTRTNSDNTGFQALVKLLDEDLAIRDGVEHAFYAQFNKTAQIHHVVVCYADGEPVGCGAFKKYGDEEVEIKRMYVINSRRGGGIGGQVLTELETWAKQLGNQSCLLETGKKQPEAIALYKKMGYAIISNFGQYQGVENSVCMRKHLKV